MECAGVMAGEGNVERFLSREGEDVWMGADEHARLEERLAYLVGGAKRGISGQTKQLEAMRADLQGRIETLKSGAEAEVPESLVALEIGRLERQLAQTEVH